MLTTSDQPTRRFYCGHAVRDGFNHSPARFVTLACRNTSRSLLSSKAALKCSLDAKRIPFASHRSFFLFFSRYFSLPTMASPKESEHSSVTRFHTEVDGHIELQIDSSSMMTLNNGGYATSEDIEIQTPLSAVQFFYEEKHASIVASPPPSLPIAEPSVIPKYSAKWRRKKWDKMVARGRWPRIIYATVFFALLMGWVGVMIGFTASEKRYGVSLNF